MSPEDDPDLFQCSLCDQWRDTAERHTDRSDTGPGDWCDHCAAKPWR